MIEYILSKFIENEKFSKVRFLILMIDGTRKEGIVASVSNGVLVLERAEEGYKVNDFIIISMISAVELAINIDKNKEKESEQYLVSLFGELKKYNNGTCVTTKLINCIKDSEKPCILTRCFLSANHRIDVLVEDYNLALSEISLFKSSYISDIDIRINLLVIVNDSINTISIPEQCKSKNIQDFKCFKYIKQ